MMENANHGSPDEIQRKEGKAPVSEINKPLFFSIGGMKATIDDPTEAESGENPPEYGHYYIWKPLRQRQLNRVLVLLSLHSLLSFSRLKSEDGKRRQTCPSPLPLPLPLHLNPDSLKKVSFV